jgi:hypothetical protein
VRRLVLRARVAAARFRRLKANVSRWTPALLRWARRVERARMGASSHSTTQVHSHAFRGSWVTHLNLHFHLAAWRGTQAKSDRAFAMVAHAVRRSECTQEVQLSVRAFTHRPAHRSLRLSKPSLGRATEKEFTDAPREPARQTWHVARVPVRNARTTKNSAAALPAWATQSPVDLVWRAPSDQSTAGPPHSTSARPARTSAAAPSLPTPPADSRTSEQTIVRAAALEPGLAERLADDVIRRIDRRARIERERKGM